MIYMMAFAILAVALSIQVQAGPIPIPASKPEPEAATFEAMDPTKMEVFERAEDATIKFIDKRALPDIKVAVRSEPEAAAVFEAMDPIKMEVFERAEDATAKFIAKRAVTVEGDNSSAIKDDAAIGSASVPDDTAEKHEAATDIKPIPPPPRCDIYCPDIWQPVCAHNKLGDKRTFRNTCELYAWNCMHHFNAYVEDYKGECEAK
ncbi:hypothetical protein BGZ97_009052 [Linnemannia gamsii]|uniref:Kazal-like domain-containing protein n=1 Tax=Linnemannia gamsii TaxID=64522 RepID=A0A9P6RAQ3_9FUNG|nr:hypothetical protein BGZ97_009052 [Linnemannia gamsii]